MQKLFGSDLKVINVGLTAFKETLDEHQVDVVQVDWKPPIDVDPGIRSTLLQHQEQIQKANLKAVDKILSSKPYLTGLGNALDVIPDMHEKMLLHAGPPVAWEEMCGPMRGAVTGALVYEGLAQNPDEAQKIAAEGGVEFAPCHEHSTVGPMAGVVSASMPVFIVHNDEHDNTAYCTMNEGLGKVLRYGAYESSVIEKLKWMEQVLYPTLQKALTSLGKVDLKSIIAQALHMGDEVHNRNRAATSLLYRQLAPEIVRAADNTAAATSVLDFIHGNDHFFLNLSMPACKASLDSGRDIESSSLVVAMSRNGTEFGIQLSGTGDEWFTGIAPVPDALFFPGYTKEDANPDIGDSSITETNGLGGFAIAAAPAIVQFVGGSAQDAVNYTLQMYEISVAENNVYQIPYLNFRGTPTGIDVIKVIENNILPFIDTGVAHRQAGIGQVGAGVLSAPVEPFKQAVAGLTKKLSNKGKK
jgi:hypothetical protein